MSATKYIYQADLFCEQCGREICCQLDAQGKRPANVEDESSYDSADYPKTVAAHDGSTDVPENCYQCSRLLEYTLTPEGVRYVMAAIRECLAGREHSRNAIRKGPRFGHYDGSRE